MSYAINKKEGLYYAEIAYVNRCAKEKSQESEGPWLIYAMERATGLEPADVSLGS